MKTAKVPELKVPTQEQVERRKAELVAEEDQRELEFRLGSKESLAMTQLLDELNPGRPDDAATQAAVDRGMTFVKDVWPTHPAADKLVGENFRGTVGGRPVGARWPWRLEEDGLWYVDYWVASPVFPAGRLPEGAVVLAFLVGDVWRYGTPNAPQVAGFGGKVSGGSEMLRAFGLRMNPEPLRGSPERPREPFEFGAKVVDDGRVRSSDDLLWSFTCATQNEVMAVVSP